MALFDKLKSLFGKKPAARPLSTKGHRGHAFGSREDPDLSAENRAKWKTLGGQYVEDFVQNGEIMFVHSTNVAAAQYHKDAQKLMIEYLDGSAYLYSPISESMAYTFAEYDSKGGFVWDYLRLRGKGADHRHRPGITAVKIR